jgi:hypothetical protein
VESTKVSLPEIFLAYLMVGLTAFGMAALAFIAVRWFKLDVIWVFAGGIVLWIAMHAIGIA